MSKKESKWNSFINIFKEEKADEKGAKPVSKRASDLASPPCRPCLSLAPFFFVCVFFNCQQLIPCRNVANSPALILCGAVRQLPFTADERVCRRQLHYLFIIYDRISADNGKGEARLQIVPLMRTLLWPFSARVMAQLINRKLLIYLKIHFILF